MGMKKLAESYQIEVAEQKEPGMFEFIEFPLESTKVLSGRIRSHSEYLPELHQNLYLSQQLRYNSLFLKGYYFDHQNIEVLILHLDFQEEERCQVMQGIMKEKKVEEFPLNLIRE
jgi:hypothetical protein